MKLYYAPGACSLSPHIVAREGGLPVEISKVTFDGSVRTTAEGEDFFAVNPRGGYVPAFRLVSGEVLTEGPAIIQYLADQAPEKRLTPVPGSVEHYRMLSWIAFVSTELHKAFGPLFNPNLPADQREAAVAKITKRYQYVDETLADKEYLMGTFTIADAYLYTILRWSPRANLDLSTYTNLSSFMKRMETREGVQTALEEEGLEKIG